MSAQPSQSVSSVTAQVSPQVSGTEFTKGAGFSALSFKAHQFDGMMDPLVMADHYTMSESTFGAHPHAGMSAVSVLFEDSQGGFHNRDSLGNDFDLQPGDLYWLKAGRGAVHDEAPRPGARAHGLQLFVNLPARMKQDAPESLHVRAADMPLLQTAGTRVRLVLGETQGIRGASSPTADTTILDGRLQRGAHFMHALAADHSAWVYSVSGSLILTLGDEVHTLAAGQSLSLRQETSDVKLNLQLQGGSDAHFVVITAPPVRETFIQRGPFVMSSSEELDQVEKAYSEGKLGRLA